MLMSPRWLEELSAVAWPALVNHIWQATVIALICCLVLLVFRRSGARARHAFLLVALVRFAIPPVLVLFVADQLGFESSKYVPLQRVSAVMSHVTQPMILAIRQTASADAPEPGSELFCLLTLIWLSGCFILLIRWWLRNHRFAILLRMSRRECGTPLMDTIQSLMKRLQMAPRKKIQVVFGNFEPGVWGVWRPVLVLPENISEKLEPGEIEAILAHELIHIARWDNLWGLLQMLVCCAFWFHPLVWILDRRLICERERICDERVVEVLRDSSAYVSGLVKMIGLELGLQVNGAASMAGANLKARIKNIMRIKTVKKTGWHIWLLFSAVAVLALLLYLFATPLQKSLAQTAAGSGPGDRVIFQVEDAQDSPLKILSPSSLMIDHPGEIVGREARLRNALAKSGFTIQNTSDRVMNSIILEFTMPGSSLFYHAAMPNGIAPNGTYTLGVEEVLRVFESGSNGGVISNIVRPAAATFAGGNMWRLPSLPPPSPVPSPPPASPRDVARISASKSISVSIEHSGKQTFDISRLDGSVLVLEGEDGAYQSTPIMTDGDMGKCRFDQPIPVGDYRLNISAFRIQTPIIIPDLPQRAMTLRIGIGSSVMMAFQ